MSETKFTRGDATITLTGDLAAQMRAVVSKMLGGALEAIEAEAEKVAADARKEWYGPKGVRLITGESGDIQVVTTIDESKSRVVVSVGSTDTSGIKKPRVVFIHSPGALSRRLVTATVEQWRKTSRDQRGPFSAANLSAGAKKQFAGVTFPAIYEVTPGAGAGHGVLIQALVVRPMRAAIAANIGRIGVSIGEAAK